jgi:D-glycero-D-manno-heptose 1,7-bisphosphate phosphatase
VIISNQPGLAFGHFSAAELSDLVVYLRTTLGRAGVPLAGFYACPHAPPSPYERGCSCRKPLPGLLHQAANDLHIDLGQSWMIGDILNDVEAGRRAGCSSILLDAGNETEWDLRPGRVPHHVVTSLWEVPSLVLGPDVHRPSCPETLHF